MTTHYEVLRDPLVRAHCGAAGRRRPRRSPTRPYGTAAPSAARWRTPTRPATCPRWRWRWTPSSSSRAPAAGVPSRRRSSSSTTCRRRWSRTRCWSRSACPSSTGLGLPLREVPPGRAVVGDRRRRRRGPPRTTDPSPRRGSALTNMGSTPIRATAVEQALTGAAPDGVAAAAEHAAEGTSPASDLNGKADYRQHLARVLTRRAVSAAAGG